MAATPADPCPRTALTAELEALERELRRGGPVEDERLRAASLAVRTARAIVGGAGEPLDRDTVALLRVAAACATAAAAAPDAADAAAALTLIAKRMTASTQAMGAAEDAALDHVRSTLAEIAGRSTDAGHAGDSSRSADAPPGDAA